MNHILDRFQRDVANHSMEVLHEDGLYRHLRFSNGGSAIDHFNITTWPGYLCISGDMGCFVFSRVRDMFGFFRDERGRLAINPGYWAEKLQAGAGCPPRELIKDWSAERFREAIRGHFESYAAELEEEEKADLWRAIEEDVLDHEDDGHDAMRAAMEFHYTNGANDFEFADFWEHDCTEWCIHYLWCCYAIVWAISQYDQQQEVAA